MDFLALMKERVLKNIKDTDGDTTVLLGKKGHMGENIR
jgi:hypothetical protein